MIIRRPRVVMTAVISLLLVAGCKRSPAPVTTSCDPAPNLVACVDAGKIYLDEVTRHVHAPGLPLGGAPQKDPRRLALDAVVRAHLFADEAARRGISVEPGPAAIMDARRVQALEAAELAAKNVSSSALSDAEVRAYFDAHPDEFRVAPERVWIAAIVVADSALADRLAKDAAKTDDPGFRALVAKHSVDEPSRSKNGDYAVYDEAKLRAAADPVPGRLAMALRFIGAVGGPIRLSDGRYAIFRATEVQGAPVRAWDNKTALFVRNQMFAARRHALLDELAAQLLATARVVVHEDVLATVKVPVDESP